MKTKKENLLNKKFGRLLVIEETESIKGYTVWKCQCDCGAIKIVRSHNLKSGDTKSCGCFAIECAKNNISKYNKSGVLRTKYPPLEVSARDIWRDRYSDGG